MHSLYSKSVVLLFLSPLLAPMPKSFASAIVDQSNVGATGFDTSGVPSVFAQTFTVGTSGQLTGFDLRMMRVNFGIDTGSFVVELRETTSGIPTARLSSPLATLTDSDMVLPTQSEGVFVYSGFSHFDISYANVFVHIGDVLAIDIFGSTGTDGNNGLVVAGTYGGYSGGNHFGGFIDHPAWTSYPDNDLIFRTYVDAAVPEPCSFAMFCGMPLLLLRRRVNSPSSSF